MPTGGMKFDAIRGHQARSEKELDWQTIKIRVLSLTNISACFFLL
jgi:hypothetical protein